MNDLGPFDLLCELFPLHRSLTGEGNRKTLEILKREIPELKIKTINSGASCFDWKVPLEWVVKRAFVIDPNGNKILDFAQNNLHLVGYSVPQNLKISREDLESHLHSLKEMPSAIPYVTSYYEENWGFCLSHKQREALPDGIYHVIIDTEFVEGSLTYGEVKLPGKTQKELFFSTYICHPSMANNELSGPVVLVDLIKNFIKTRKNYYSYRILFAPETIGTICYLSKNLQLMKKNIVAGFNVSCVGDDGPFSIVHSRTEETLADKTLQHVLKWTDVDFKQYSFLSRGSNERQYCSPNVDLPVVTFCRSKFATYPEYHTSLDNLDFVKKSALLESVEVLKKVITSLEKNTSIRATQICEPQLGKRGLYPNVSKRGSTSGISNLMNLLAFADGRRLLEIANKLDVPIWTLYEDLNLLAEHKLIQQKR